jgi:phosphohistidine phosphatase
VTTLTLLRHAKSGWDDPALRDFDRPLNPKGRRAAQTIGRDWRARGLAFDHVVASPAMRVQETLAEVEAGYGRRLDPVWDRRIYLAEPDTLLEIARAFPAGAGCALVAGHSPGLERLVLMLAERSALTDEVATKYPTASVAELALADGWASLRNGGATLARFTRPRDLDPSLGPDEG